MGNDQMWLMKHPSGLPRVLKWSQRNSRSARKTQAETSSTKLRRCVMPPAPSLPGLPFLSRWAARARRSLSSGFRRHVTTRDAKMGERGQPWLTPSSMSRVRQVPSAHLWWTVMACLENRVVRGRISGKDLAITLKKG